MELTSIQTKPCLSGSCFFVFGFLIVIFLTLFARIKGIKEYVR